MDHVHAERLLDGPDIQFRVPSLMVEIGDVGMRVLALVQQGGGHDDLTAAATAFVHRVTDFADGECFGHGRVGRFVHPFGACWALPDHNVIVPTEAAAAAKIVMALLMQAKSGVGAALQQ